jgi:haloalkane dehalogenase
MNRSSVSSSSTRHSPPNSVDERSSPPSTSAVASSSSPAQSVAAERSSSPLTSGEVLRRMKGAPDRVFDVGHAQVASWSFGVSSLPAKSAPTLVMVHGWPLTGRTWRHLVPRLAARHRIHVLDLPGVGQSTVTSADDIAVDAHVRALRAVLEQLAEDVVLVGQDSGGAIARKAAADNPRVRGVVLGNTELPDHVPWQVHLYVALVRSGLGRLLAASMSSRWVRRSPLGIGGCYVDVDAFDAEFSDIVVADFADPMQAAGHLAFAKSVDTSFTKDLALVHARIRCPTVCIWGTHDPFFPIDKARAMLPGFAGGATLHEIPGGKLFVHEDRADEFAAAMTPLLSTLMPPS